jgi:hypothetical protein
MADVAALGGGVQSNVRARVVITDFADGRPVGVEATCDPIYALQLLAFAISDAGTAIRKQVSGLPGMGEADPVDKERKYLGPREIIDYGKDVGKKKDEPH